MERYWAVGQTWTGKEHRARADIEDVDHGAFVPTFELRVTRRGLEDVTERPLLPGYVLFKTGPDDWGNVADIEGVRVLSHGMVAGRVREAEIERLMRAHVSGAYNRAVVVSHGKTVTKSKQARRGRKPRPGNRIRKRTAP